MKGFRHRISLAIAWLVLSFPGFAADVLTYHNDNARTGLNPAETTLAPKNVNAGSFGLLRNLRVDGQVYAQPLYASRAQVFSAGRPLGVHNLLIVATEHDSVYAFDADSGTLYWKASMLGAGEVPSDPSPGTKLSGTTCDDLVPEVGITSTPVIDRNLGPHGTLFVLAMSASPDFASHFYRLHALDLSTGHDVLAPALIQASFPDPGGQGPIFDTTTRRINFDPSTSRARAALVLANGNIYTQWASFCDEAPYSGWIIAYNERTLTQTLVLSVNPNGTPPSVHEGVSGNGIWQTGEGAAVDASGNLFVATSNGPFDGVGDWGDSVLRLSPSLQVLDYFTPFDQQNDDELNQDLGSGGAMILNVADSGAQVHHLLIQAGKDSNLYVLNRDNLGKFNPSNNSQIYQELPGALPGGVFGSPAFFNGWVYYGPVKNSLRQFQFTRSATLNPVPLSVSSATFGFPGTTPSVSSSGTQNGIVWAYERGTNGQAILHAYDATNVADELYNSSQVQIGVAIKFSVPTVCNGKVFVGTANSVAVFGLHALR